MKAKNLTILKEHGINVPSFIIVDNIKDINLESFTCSSFAVRSSFLSEEDKNNLSTEQFATKLNVERLNVESVALELMNNMQNSGLVRFSKKGSNMHVIIQEMINADISGVMFTSNPNGQMNETIIVAGKELGKNFVEDNIDTITYFYNNNDNNYYYDDNNSGIELSEDIIKQLAEIGQQIEKIFEYPMDIEFAIKKDENEDKDVIYVLQVSPIASIEINYNPIVLDNSSLAKTYPDISLPLTQSFIKEIHYLVLKSFILRMTNDEYLVSDMDHILNNLIDSANGRIYYRINNWYDIIYLMPQYKKLIPMWQDMLGIENREINFSLSNVNKKTRKKFKKSVKSYLLRSPAKMKELNEFFNDSFDRYNEMVNETDDIKGLLFCYKTIRDELCYRWDVTLINDIYTFWFSNLTKNKDAIEDIEKLESMKSAIELGKLSSIKDKKGVDSEEYIKAKKEYMYIYGDRCENELKLETHTYRTHPELLDDACDNYYISTEQLQVKETVKKEKWALKCAKVGITNKETSIINRTRIFGITRNIMLKIGKILVEENKLEDIEDVFYLYINEFDKNLDFKKLVSERKLEYEMYKELPPYSRLVFNNKVVNKTFGHVSRAKMIASDALFGTGISMGKVSGEVIEVDKVDEKVDVTDKIIVATSTNADWTPLIKKCKGIIVERGSILSHTAIVTRELNKPSIIIKDAKNFFVDGDIVEINSYKGTAIIKKRNESEE